MLHGGAALCKDRCRHAEVAAPRAECRQKAKRERDKAECIDQHCMLGCARVVRFSVLSVVVEFSWLVSRGARNLCGTVGRGEC